MENTNTQTYDVTVSSNPEKRFAAYIKAVKNLKAENNEKEEN